MKKIIKKILKNYSIGTVRLNVEFLNKFLLSAYNENQKLTVLDIGCGFDSLIRHNDKIYKIGYDGHKKSLDQAKLLNTHDEYILGTFDELENKFLNREFDFIIAIDFIEHLQKDDGYKLLNFIERKAKIGSAIFTPNGFLFQPSIEERDFMKHLSGWNCENFTEKGYKVYGATGLKFLRKEFHQIKYQPKIFWGFLSYLSQFLFTKYFPNYAAAIWALKHYKKK